ncbi:hypothetical protein MMC29_002088 [Sticta canariensis]|nr:hypothetical protein [Sticta canariensis]
MTTSTPPTNEPAFAFDNGEILYDRIDALQDDYFELLHHMRINGETVVPLWVFRSFCESYARFLQKVSKGSEEDAHSAQDSNLTESRDREDEEIQENGLMKHGALAVGETKEPLPRDSGMQEHFDPVKAKAYHNFENKKSKHDEDIQVNDLMMHGALAVDVTQEPVSRYSGMQERSDPDRTITQGHTGAKHPKHSSTYFADAYEVLMSGVPTTSMDLSNRNAVLRVAQELINCNGLAEPSSPTTDNILYVCWQNSKRKVGSFAPVCIGFTRVELVQRAVNDGIQWAGKRRTCIPWAIGHRLHQCVNCLRFGHSIRECTNKRRCPDCGLEHLGKRCQSTTPRTCLFCSGPHTTRSSRCPQRIHEMSKAGFWPIRVKVLNATFPFRDKGSSGLQGRTEFQPPNQSDIPTGTSEATENFPDPTNPKKIIKYLDRLRVPVLASRPTLSTTETPMQNKRKARAPVDRASRDCLTESSKRLKREEVQIKQEAQEEQENLLAQWERLYT